jgi:hypothetical protein
VAAAPARAEDHTTTRPTLSAGSVRRPLMVGNYRAGVVIAALLLWLEP